MPSKKSVWGVPNVGRSALAVSAAFAISYSAGAVDEPVLGAADRSLVTVFLYQSGSSLATCDHNGDGFVSDVDYAFAIRDRLVALYGDDLQAGDLDGDGYQTAEDVIYAIAQQISLSLGKSSPVDETPVGVNDVAAVADLVGAGDGRGDVNFDASLDSHDIADVLGKLGTDPDLGSIDDAARDIYAYIEVLIVEGDSFYMYEGFGGSDRQVTGISNTWPSRHPKWWKPNHLTSVSVTYFDNENCQIPHSYASSSEGQPPMHGTHLSVEDCDEHLKSISYGWPPNHSMVASASWRPVYHQSDTSELIGDPEEHDRPISRAYPPGHYVIQSAEWWDHESSTSSEGHFRTTSRGWWANHTRGLSRLLEHPPDHHVVLSAGWVHEVAHSSMMWPPNHLYEVSSTWGPGGQHAVGHSSLFPPSHVVDASNTWPGPQPSWPPNHTLSMSKSWSEPSPSPWPVFPPGHSWWTTFRDIVPIPRWPFPGIPQPG